ncbi:hypothetical protein D9756_010410 [Leucocoprinus leucothites]|uniref:Cytochrome P450 n=1 Tax=Leucocoprinus leucothites TaxID=201217 RepID=A0A8H5CTI1_9AGAR|nr:hypothetical protein D9756_010410 [Leucoagaricus leucothites]
MAFMGLRDVIVLCLCLTAHFAYRRSVRRSLLLPPSLSGWPIVGNTFQLPLKYAYMFYQDLEKKLGSKIMYVEALGQPFIVINDARIASELLDKRSAIYSSRPRLPMFELIGGNQFFVLLPYGDEWRNQRRMFQQHFSKRSLPREQEKALEFTRKALLPNLYKTPQSFPEHIKEYVCGMALSMVYGLPIKRNHDPLFASFDDAFNAALVMATPGKYLVDIFPFLNYIPDWVPGIPFKRDSWWCREKLAKAFGEPFKVVQKNMEEDVASESFVSTSLERYKNDPDYEVSESYIRKAASQVYEGASGTTVVALKTFILAMLVHPELQRKAQEEVDSVVGQDRLPDFSQRSRLPYLTAILKEVLRWNPTVPSGVPHMTTAEDVYEGYYIPRGSMILPNTYAMLHDEEMFPNPKVFNPDRFIKDGVLVEDILDPMVTATFGFGRRACPGSHIALATFYIATASILSLFDISPELDENNNPIEVKPEFIDTGLTSEPSPFQCKFIPRSGKDAGGLLAGIWMSNIFDFSLYTEY